MSYAVNVLVEWTGGRTGCLGGLYMRSVREILRIEIRSIDRAANSLEANNKKRSVDMKALKKRIKAHGEQNEQFEATQCALQLKQLQVAYRRTVKQTCNVEQIKVQLNEQLMKVNVDRSIMLVAAVMNKRFEAMPPQRFQQMMMKCEEMRMREGLREEMLEEFMDESMDGAESEDGDSVADILAEQGVVFAAPDVKPVEPTAASVMAKIDQQMSSDLHSVRPPIHEIQR